MSSNPDLNNRKELLVDDSKSNKLSMRLKRFLPNSRSSSMDSPKYQGPISSEVTEEGEHSSNEDCWVDLPNNSRNTSENPTVKSNTRGSGSDGGFEDSPPKYAEIPQQSIVGDEHCELRLEDLKWLPSSNEDTYEPSKPRTPPAVSLAVDRYPTEGETMEQNSLSSQDNEASRVQSSSTTKNTPSSINALLELQMDPVQKKRNIDFHINFPSLPLDDILIEDWHCALQKDILVTGRLYVTQERICFHSNLFGWVNHTMIPFSDIVSLQKRSTAFVIPNAIQIITLDQKYFFTSFMSRDSAFTLLYEMWYKKCPNRATDPAKLLPSTSDCKADAPCSQLSTEAGVNTLCSCLKTSSHEGVINIDTVYPTSIETAFNLLFGSDTSFLKDYLSESNHDIAIGAWQEDGTRSITYVKPLNMPIGPRQTRCIIADHILHQDYEDYCVVETRTQNPDVPSGDAFTVVSRNCFSISRTNQCRLIISTSIEWSKGSWFKGPIENGVKEGTTKAAHDLDGVIRQYLKSHPDLITKAVGDDQPETICEVQACPEKDTDVLPYSTTSQRSVWGFTPNFRNIMLVILVMLFGIYFANRWRIRQLQSEITAYQSHNSVPFKPSPLASHQLAHLRELQTNLRDLGGQLEAIENRLLKFRRQNPTP